MSFATQDTAAVARLLSPDYRLLSTDSTFRSRFPAGLGATPQVDSVARLPASPKNRNPHSGVVPDLSILGEFPDTLSAQSVLPDTSRRERVVLRSLVLRARSEDTELDLGGARCVFVAARGDVARAPAGEPCDMAHWYIVRWYAGPGVDTREALRYSLELGVAPQAELPATAFGIRRVSDLRDWPPTFEVKLSAPIPARLDVFDAAGRRVSIRAIDGTVPGPHRFRLESPRLAPGMYWLKLHQGQRDAVLKFVVLR